MDYASTGLGVILLVLCPIAFVSNLRSRGSTAAISALWRRVYWWRWVLAIPLGIAGYFGTYTGVGDGGEVYRILGFPFPAAAFDSAGRDYVSPLTPLLLVLDAILLALLPDLFLWIWRRYDQRRNAARAPN